MEKKYVTCNAHAPYIAICGLPRSPIYFPHYPINGAIFEKKKVIEHTMCFEFVYNVYLKHFSF